MCEELVPKDFVSVLDHTLPAKPTSSSMENPGEYWNEMLGAYVCPHPKSPRKLVMLPGLKPILRVTLMTRNLFSNTLPISSVPM